MLLLSDSSAKSGKLERHALGFHYAISVSLTSNTSPMHNICASERKIAHVCGWITGLSSGFSVSLIGPPCARLFDQAKPSAPPTPYENATSNNRACDCSRCGAVPLLVRLALKQVPTAAINSVLNFAGARPSWPPAHVHQRT